MSGFSVQFHPWVVLVCFAGSACATVAYGGEEVSMKFESPAFFHQAVIPAVYTCDGSNMSPPLRWSGLPSGTKSLVLMVDDPDAPDPKAPAMTWVHWLLYNLPPESDGLPEGVAAGKGLPQGTLEGLNDWKATGYGGPCPPIGQHRYSHRLYALDAVLPDLGKPVKANLQQAMRGHVLGKAEWVGVYQRNP